MTFSDIRVKAGTGTLREQFFWVKLAGGKRITTIFIYPTMSWKRHRLDIINACSPFQIMLHEYDGFLANRRDLISKFLGPYYPNSVHWVSFAPIVRNGFFSSAKPLLFLTSLFLSMLQRQAVSYKSQTVVTFMTVSAFSSIVNWL